MHNDNGSAKPVQTLHSRHTAHFNLPPVRWGDIPATPRCRSVLTGLSIGFIIEV